MTEAREYLTATGEKCHDPYLRCALYGAAQTVLGITGCCVLSHAPQGCNMLVSSAFGWQDADYTETLTLCTKLCEDEIVHGGEELLARTILEARQFEIPIVFVLSSCGPEIVGDDIDSLDIGSLKGIVMTLPSGKITDRLGERQYRDVKEKKGRKKSKEKRKNEYGRHNTHLTLTNNGMTLDSDMKYVYFLPEDIPGGKLIKYELRRLK